MPFGESCEGPISECSRSIRSVVEGTHDRSHLTLGVGLALSDCQEQARQVRRVPCDRALLPLILPKHRNVANMPMLENSSGPDL